MKNVFKRISIYLMPLMYIHYEVDVNLKTWKNKPLIPDHNRNADDEMVELGLEIHQIIELLENGVEVNKRKKGIIEKWCHRGQNIYIVAIEDYDDYWLIRHVGKIRASKNKIKIMRGEI